jgi:hypothetical protein
MWGDPEPESKKVRNDDDWFPNIPNETNEEFFLRLDDDDILFEDDDFDLDFQELSFDPVDNWKESFKRDFPNLYSPKTLPEIFTPTTISSNMVCKMLDKISGNSKEKSYWKLLYDYHTNLHIVPKWRFDDKFFSLSRNRKLVDSYWNSQKEYDIDQIQICAVSKDTIMCFGGSTGLLSRSFNNENWVENDYPQDFMRDNSRKFAWRCVFQMLQGKTHPKVKDLARVLAFEIRNNYLFFSAETTTKQRKRINKKTQKITYNYTYQCILGPNLVNREYPYLLVDPVVVHGDRKISPSTKRIGLIGDYAYFYTTGDGTVIVNPTRENPKIFIPNKKVCVCYNTVSSCFIQYSEGEYAPHDFLWCILTQDETKPVSRVKSPKNFSLDKKFTLNENYWVWYDSNRKLAVLNKEGKLYDTILIDDNPMTITDMCIVGDWLYVLSLPGICIINLKDLQNQRYCRFKVKFAPDYIRAHPLGFVMCHEDPTKKPIFLIPEEGDFRLLGSRNTFCKVCDNKPIGKCCDEAAYYCSTKCQEKDWYSHEKDCKRK